MLLVGCTSRYGFTRPSHEVREGGDPAVVIAEGGPSADLNLVATDGRGGDAAVAAPLISSASTAGDPGCVPISMTIEHPASLPIDITVEVQPWPGAPFEPAILGRDVGGPPPESLIGVTSSPAGSSHRFFWDSLSQAPISTTVTLRITATEPGSGRTDVWTEVFSVDNGPDFAPVTNTPSCGAHAACTFFSPTSIEVADLDGDTRRDLVVGQDAGLVSVIFGNGDGTFGVIDDYVIQFDASDLWVGLLDTDGELDVAAVSYNDNGVKVFWGGGGGALAAATDHGGTGMFRVGTPYAVAVADLDGDLLPELYAAGDNDRVVGLEAAGGRTFAPNFLVHSIGPSFGLESMVLGDVTGDGSLDILTAGFSSIYVTVGNDTLSGWMTATIAATGEPSGLQLADVNGDTRLDVLAAMATDDVLAVLINDGSGLAYAVTTYPVTPSPRRLDVTDINGDAQLDVVVADEEGANLTVLMGRSDATFVAGAQMTTTATPAGGGRFPAQIKTRDLNDDMRPDIVVASPAAQGVAVFLNQTAPIPHCDPP